MAPEGADREQRLFDRALGRITRLTVALGGAGCLIWLFWRGWKWALPFVLGTAASYLNFRWLKRLVDALAGALSARPSPKFAILFGLRYVVLGAGGYAIVNFTSLSLPAALTGLFVPVAAVIGEIIFELVTDQQ